MQKGPFLEADSRLDKKFQAVYVILISVDMLARARPWIVSHFVPNGKISEWIVRGPFQI